MLTVKENTTFVGISELRGKMDEIVEKAREHKVVIEKRNTPVAALVSIEKYNEMERMLDTFEDIALGYLSRERETGSKTSDYITIEQVEKRLKK